MNKHRHLMKSLRDCEVSSMDAVLFSISPDTIEMSGTLEAPALVDFFETMFRADPNFAKVMKIALERISCQELLH